MTDFRELACRLFGHRACRCGCAFCERCDAPLFVLTSLPPATPGPCKRCGYYSCGHAEVSPR